MPGVMTNLGLLEGGKLTPIAKQTIIQRHRKIQEQGGEKGSLFPCANGAKVAPVPKDQQLPADIEDESKYPDYHKEVLGAYEQILNALDVEGQFSLPPPFMDPLVISQKLGGDLSGSFSLEQMLSSPSPAGLPLIAGVDIADFLEKVDPLSNDPNALIKPPPVQPIQLPEYQTPAYFDKLKNISLPIPAPGFTTPFPDKIESELWKSPQLGLAKVTLDILGKITQDPTVVLDLLSVPPSPCFIIDAIHDAKIFGTAEDGASARTAIDQDKIDFTSAAVGTALIGLTMGDGGRQGATGAFAQTTYIIVPDQAVIPPPVGNRLAAVKTRDDASEIASIIKNLEPSLGKAQIALLLAHINAEVGIDSSGKLISCWSHNVGNFRPTKKKGAWPFYQIFASQENMPEGHFKAYKKLLINGVPLGSTPREPRRPEDDIAANGEFNSDGTPRYPIEKYPYAVMKEKPELGAAGRSVLFFPPAEVGAFEAFQDLKTGLQKYLNVIKGRKNAWAGLLTGNAQEFGKGLSTDKYHTADEKVYTNLLKSGVPIGNQFA